MYILLQNNSIFDNISSFVLSMIIYHLYQRNLQARRKKELEDEKIREENLRRDKELEKERKLQVKKAVFS